MKNSSCEKVEIENETYFTDEVERNEGFRDGENIKKGLRFKPIIPKPQEPILEYTNTNDCTSMIYNSKEELKQLTDLEIAIKLEEIERQELKQEWQEIFPNIIWEANTAPSGEQHFYFKRHGDEIIIKGNWENAPNDLKGFEINFKK